MPWGLLLLLGTALGACPDCSTWAGTVSDVCGVDGVTYASECELLIALCLDGTITFGDGTDVNSLPVSMIVASHKNNDGACSGGGGGDNCPNCTAVLEPIPVCDSSLTEFNDSCSMAKKMCDEGILSFDDGTDFLSMTETDYRHKIGHFVYWNGKCSGPCPAGEYSSSGQYGPCQPCSPGHFAGVPGSDRCTLCPQDSYQPDAGTTSCIPCPNGTDTMDKGATNSSMCLPDCVPGHYSSTGKAPCAACLPGTWSSNSSATSCRGCGRGNFTLGTECVPCPVGTHSALSNVSSCQACPTGSFANETGALNCSACAPGSFQNGTGAPFCRMCPAGSYNNVSGSARCAQCAAGHYQIELGRSFCFSCGVGTYQPTAGQQDCHDCPVGSYRERAGGVACTKCAQGTTTDSTGSISRTECHFTTCEAGSKVVILNNKVTCVACPRGYYQNRQNQTACSKCPWDTYQDTEGSSACVQCPENHVTYTEAAVEAGDCEGPEIVLATGTSFTGSNSVIYDKRVQLAANMRGKVRSFKATRGDWYVFSGSRYNSRKIRLAQGVSRTDVNNGAQYPKISGMSSGAFYSLRPVVTNVMCYTERGKLYTGYRAKTQKGVVCQNWQSNSPHNNPNQYSGQGIGNHNYCRNPDNDQNGPWCYTTDPNRIWDYCGVPKCKWNVDCYTERGALYRGTKTKTAGNSYNCNDWYSNWPHPHSYDNDENAKKYGVGHHRFCRNPNPGDDNRPWCYTTYFFKRWSYCDVAKCEFSSTGYFDRNHSPKTGV